MEVFQMKSFFAAALFLTLTLTLISGCATDKKVASPDGDQAKVSGDKSGDDGLGAGKKERVSGQDDSLDKSRLKAGELSDEQIRIASRDIFKDVHYDYDRYEVKDSDKAVLRVISEWMIAHKGAKVLIEGHCDDRGSNEYNLGLGDQRAQAAKNYLNTLGVTSERMETVSYGEEKPICTDKTETCWASNRRAHFVLIK
jgi:peptidoglycan-associated lipoprotein